MTRVRLSLVLASMLCMVTALVAVPGAAVGAADAHPIRPGVQMITEGAQCTGNFEFKDKAGHVYIGMAAHCAGKGDSSDTNGCTTASYPLGTKVQFVVGSNLFDGGTLVGTGTLRYSSWLAMHQAKTKDENACDYNDLALVRVDKKYLSRVSPTVPIIGGPVGFAKAFPPVGATVYSVGSSSMRGSTEAKTGSVTARSSWTMTVRTGSPGVPGDSGSGFMGPNGGAIGVLSTLDLFPDTGANGVGSLYREVVFARSHGVPGLRLIHGAKFTGQQPVGASTAGLGGLLGGLGGLLG